MGGVLFFAAMLRFRAKPAIGAATQRCRISPGEEAEPQMSFEYRCVAGPTIVAVRNSKARDQAVKAFEEIMNAQAADGWEYVGIDEFHISEPQGLLSRKRVYVPSKILVFRRVKAGSVQAAPMMAAVPHQAAPSPLSAPAPAAAPPVIAADAAQEPKDSPEFRSALQAMSEKLRAARG